MTSPVNLALGKAKLESSGLTLEDAKLLGITIHDNLQLLAENFDPVPGLKFEYKDLFGQPMITRPGYGPYWRVRKFDLEPPPAKGFDKSVDKDAPKDKKKEKKNEGMPKYSQIKGTVAGPYFPNNIPEDLEQWPEIALNVETSLVITEGELKAAKSCKEGVPCIGLGGVWNFKSQEQGFLFLPALEEIEWKKRNVYVIFDSDMFDNENVVDAMNELAEQLYLRGATPYCVFLPKVEELGDKTGLDDYIIHRGINTVKDLCRNCMDDLTTIRAAWEWNKHWYHIVSPHCVVNRQTGELTKKEDYVAAHQELSYLERSAASGGESKVTMVSLAQKIFQWPLHSKLDRLVYDPAQLPLAKIDGESCFNTWTGWACEPKEGDVSMYLELLDQLFGTDTVERAYYLQWIAYQIQNPGVKLASAVLMIGKPGAGKSMLAEIMEHIFGKNFKRADINNFFGQFNEWAAHSQFVLADEVIVKQDKDRKIHASALKDYVTRKKVTINEKYGLKYTIDDHCNIYMTANPMDSLPLDNDDRRYFVFKSNAMPLTPDFKRRWDRWKEMGGARHLFYFLLNQVDTSTFDPHGEALVTESKRDIVDFQRTDGDAFVREIMEHGPMVGQIQLTAEVFSVPQIWATMEDEQRRVFRGSQQALQRALLESGCIKLDGGMVDKRMKWEGRNTQFYAVRNFAKWSAATPDDIKKHLKEHFPSSAVSSGGKF